MDLEQQVSTWQRKVEVHKMTKQRVLKSYFEAFPPKAKFDKDRNSAYTIASAKSQSRESAKLVKLNQAIASQPPAQEN